MNFYKVFLCTFFFSLGLIAAPLLANEDHCESIEETFDHGDRGGVMRAFFGRQLVSDNSFLGRCNQPQPVFFDFEAVDDFKTCAGLSLSLHYDSQSSENCNLKYAPTGRRYLWLSSGTFISGAELERDLSQSTNLVLESRLEVDFHLTRGTLPNGLGQRELFRIEIYQGCANHSRSCREVVLGKAVYTMKQLLTKNSSRVTTVLIPAVAIDLAHYQAIGSRLLLHRSFLELKNDVAFDLTIKSLQIQILDRKEFQ